MPDFRQPTPGTPDEPNIVGASPPPSAFALEALRRGQHLRKRRQAAHRSFVAVLVLAVSAGVGLAVIRFSGHSQETPTAHQTTTTTTLTTPPPPLPATEVAVVHSGVLSLVNETTGRVVVLASGPYDQFGSAITTPLFSEDGQFVAYLEQLGTTSSVHVVTAKGVQVLDLQGADAYAWSPVADELAASLPSAVELLNSKGEVLHQWSVRQPGSEIFSPSGSEVAVSSVVYHPGVVATGGSLLVLPTAGGKARTVIAFTPDVCQIPAGWTTDGSRVLSWQDGACSASIAADGLPLEAVSANGGTPVRLGTTLVHRSWVLPVGGTSIVEDYGNSRVAATSKVLRSCDTVTGSCQDLPIRSGAAAKQMSSLDPALAPAAGELWEVRVAQSTAANDFLPGGTLWVMPINGAHGPSEVRSAGTNVADPDPDADGSVVTFVRMTSATSATLNVLNVSTGAVHEIAPVEDDDYYGEFQAAEVLAVWMPPKA